MINFNEYEPAELLLIWDTGDGVGAENTVAVRILENVPVDGECTGVEGSAVVVAVLSAPIRAAKTGDE